MNVWKSLPKSKEHLAVLHFQCSRLSEELEKEHGIKISTDVVGVVTEATFRFAQVLATDLEAFAKHAHRSTIILDDIHLFVRRNACLVEFVDEKMAASKSSTIATDTKIINKYQNCGKGKGKKPRLSDLAKAKETPGLHSDFMEPSDVAGGSSRKLSPIEEAEGNRNLDRPTKDALSIDIDLTLCDENVDDWFEQM